MLIWERISEHRGEEERGLEGRSGRCLALAATTAPRPSPPGPCPRSHGAALLQDVTEAQSLSPTGDTLYSFSIAKEQFRGPESTGLKQQTLIVSQRPWVRKPGRLRGLVLARVSREVRAGGAGPAVSEGIAGVDGSTPRWLTETAVGRRPPFLALWGSPRAAHSTASSRGRDRKTMSTPFTFVTSVQVPSRHTAILGVWASI